MQWNGPYGALLFINAWEYTQDAAFAKATTLPLLDGLNLWTHCFLFKNGTLLEDWNAIIPDQIFENGRCNLTLSNPPECALEVTGVRPARNIGSVVASLLAL